jgi:hypothetical protein
LPLVTDLRFTGYKSQFPPKHANGFRWLPMLDFGHRGAWHYGENLTKREDESAGRKRAIAPRTPLHLAD